MSVKLYGWAWGQAKHLSPTAHHVLLALCERADKSGVCFPSQSTLAAMTGWGERTVRRGMAELEEAELIERSRRSRRDGSRTSDEIRLRIDHPAAGRVAAESPLPASESVHAAGQSEPSGRSGRARGTRQEIPSENPPVIPGDVTATFHEFVASYPPQPHDGPTQAWPAFVHAATAGADPKAIAKAAAAYAATRASESPKYTQGMRRWLEGGGWERDYSSAALADLNIKSRKLLALVEHNQSQEGQHAEGRNVEAARAHRSLRRT